MCRFIAPVIFARERVERHVKRSNCIRRLCSLFVPVLLWPAWCALPTTAMEELSTLSSLHHSSFSPYSTTGTYKGAHAREQVPALFLCFVLLPSQFSVHDFLTNFARSCLVHVFLQFFFQCMSVKKFRPSLCWLVLPPPLFLVHLFFLVSFSKCTEVVLPLFFFQYKSAKMFQSSLFWFVLPPPLILVHFFFLVSFPKYTAVVLSYPCSSFSAIHQRCLSLVFFGSFFLHHCSLSTSSSLFPSLSAQKSSCPCFSSSASQRRCCFVLHHRSLSTPPSLFPSQSTHTALPRKLVKIPTLSLVLSRPFVSYLHTISPSKNFKEKRCLYSLVVLSFTNTYVDG